MIKVNNEMMDKIIKDNAYRDICNEFGTYYYLTNYAITCDSKLFCFVGADITNAINIKDYLQLKYPDNKFEITDEFLSFTRD